MRVVAVVAIGSAISVAAQRGLSFDSGAPGACEKALGNGPASDAVIDARGFVLACADADLEQEKVEFAQVAQRENQAAPAERAAWRNLRGAFEKFRMLHIEIFGQDCGAGMDAAQRRSRLRRKRIINFR